MKNNEELGQKQRSIFHQEYHTLAIWEESLGVLQSLEQIEGSLFVDFTSGNKIKLIECSTNFADELKNEMGNKIGILRTNIPGDGYAWRLIENNINEEEKTCPNSFSVCNKQLSSAICNNDEIKHEVTSYVNQNTSTVNPITLKTLDSKKSTNEARVKIKRGKYHKARKPEDPIVKNQKPLSQYYPTVLGCSQ